MPYELELPRRLKVRGWKVKIREKERLEPPHVTVVCKKREWRIGLRDGGFVVPPGGAWNDIEDEVRAIVHLNWADLQQAWDQKYPTNPVSGKDDADDQDG